MIARSALFRSDFFFFRIIRNTWFPDTSGRQKKRCFNQIESNSIRFIKKNNLDSKVSFVDTLLRALRNETHINNRWLLLYDTYCLLFSVFGLWD